MTEEVKNEEINETVENSEVTAEAAEGEESTGDSDLAKGDSPDFKWYVTNVLSNYEARVTKTLKERILKRSKEEEREDDNIDVIQTRYAAYQDTTKKVSEKMKHLYTDLFHDIDGKEEITEIASKIEKILKI